jgi:hypothetical protein
MQNLVNFGHPEGHWYGFQILEDWKSWKSEKGQTPLVISGSCLNGSGQLPPSARATPRPVTQWSPYTAGGHRPTWSRLYLRARSSRGRSPPFHLVHAHAPPSLCSTALCCRHSVGTSYLRLPPGLDVASLSSAFMPRCSLTSPPAPSTTSPCSHHQFPSAVDHLRAHRWPAALAISRPCLYLRGNHPALEYFGTHFNSGSTRFTGPSLALPYAWPPSLLWAKLWWAPSLSDPQ